ncbi:DUF5677 domain-containing protein [Pseudalkalibacillus caeni]|uniref:Uncharacterized protein n=1 Tax=Exobacillus caeni TaxID=2574798 RepID=A0A5R9EV12_9BACL|nr:DUF5677 domain-containing protein [Pseudalkalibacillus caeni]TLS35052.1 hypothetical protein FCL54_22615 [Pseudalkalibacillus caeni]
MVYDEKYSHGIEKLAIEAKIEKLEEYVTLGTNLLLDIHKTNRKLKQHDLIIIAYYKKFLEQLDGLVLLIQHRSKSAATVTLRSVFESFLGLEYILSEDSKIKQRALSYYLGFAKEEIDVAEEVLSFSSTSPETTEKFFEIIEIHKDDLNDPIFTEVIEEWNTVKGIMNADHVNPAWYSLFYGPKNLKELSKELDVLFIYEHFYSAFSIEAHGFTALRSTHHTEMDLDFLKLRSEEELETHIHFGTRFFKILTLKITEYFSPEDLKLYSRQVSE